MWTGQKSNFSTRDWIRKEGEILRLNLNQPELIMDLKSVVFLIVFSCIGIIGPVSHNHKQRNVGNEQLQGFFFFQKVYLKRVNDKGREMRKVGFIWWEVAWLILFYYTERLRDFPENIISWAGCVCVFYAYVSVWYTHVCSSELVVCLSVMYTKFKTSNIFNNKWIIFQMCEAYILINFIVICF